MNSIKQRILGNLAIGAIIIAIFLIVEFVKWLMK